ncbi:alpha/beta hydrolase [Paraburkholderia sediminicola]
MTVATSGTSINLLVGGSGPPVLLLHGYPENLLAWRKVAPQLAQTNTVVVADLRGYGDSGKPPADENHETYSKRAMALDQVEVMSALGFDKFAVVGHDRGARVAQRLALDHPHRVEKIAVLDIVPTDYVYRTADRQVATAYYHWFFLVQPSPLPETMIERSVDTFMQQLMGRSVPTVVSPDVFADYVRCMRDPHTVRSICEDYRAGASIDLVHDAADRTNRISCPVHVLWGRKGLVGTRYDPLAIWRDYASNVSGRGLDCYHLLPEEAPEEVHSEVSRFIAQA